MASLSQSKYYTVIFELKYLNYQVLTGSTHLVTIDSLRFFISIHIHIYFHVLGDSVHEWYYTQMTMQINT